MSKYEKDAGIEKDKYKPEDGRQRAHKSHRKPTKKSDHKHEYVEYVGDSGNIFKDGHYVPTIRKKCSICGRDEMVRFLWSQEDRIEAYERFGIDYFDCAKCHKYYPVTKLSGGCLCPRCR